MSPGWPAHQPRQPVTPSASLPSPSGRSRHLRKLITPCASLPSPRGPSRQLRKLITPCASLQSPTWAISTASHAEDAMCVASRLIGLRRLPDGGTCSASPAEFALRVNFERMYLNQPPHRARSRGEKWRARLGSSGGRRGHKDGPSKSALLAPRLSPPLKKRRHTVRTHALPLLLSPECDVR